MFIHIELTFFMSVYVADMCRGGYALYQALLVWCSILSIQINDYDKGSLQSLHPSHPSVSPRHKSVSMLSSSVSAIASEM
jgi:hypothetical protein